MIVLRLVCEELTGVAVPSGGGGHPGECCWVVEGPCSYERGVLGGLEERMSSQRRLRYPVEAAGFVSRHGK